MLSQIQREMLERGATASTVRETMSKLGGLLQIAAESGIIAANPVRSLRPPRANAGEEVDPLTPGEIEALIASLPRSRPGDLRAGGSSRPETA
jgi:site-specific recombinase XerD